MADDPDSYHPYFENQVVVLSLNFKTTPDDLFTAFSQYGKIVDLHMVFNDNYESKGYAFIAYETRESAQEAIQRMNGQRFDGGLIKVNWSGRDMQSKQISKKIYKDPVTKPLIEQDLLSLTRNFRK